MSRKKLAKPDATPPADKSDVLAPFTPSDPLMAIFWVPALQYALGNDDMLAAFREATGYRWSPPKSILARMVDSATGADEAFIVAFAGWFNEHIWGDLDIVAGEGSETP